MHSSPRKRVRPLWLWAAAGVVAITVITAGALRFATASCASVRVQAAGAPPLTGVTTGQAYYYSPARGQGACSFGTLARRGLYVSLGAAQYAGGAACGSYLEVTGPAGSVRAEVVDSCPGCSHGGIDMSEAAFARVARASAGTAGVSYTLVRDPRVAGPLELRVANSASRDWLAVQVLNNGNPVTAVAVQPVGGGRWRAMRLSPNDYWAVAAGAGPGPFRVRVSDMFGDSAVASGVRLAPGTVQRAGASLYTLTAAGGPASSGATASASSAPVTNRTAATASAAAHAAGSGAGC